MTQFTETHIHSIVKMLTPKKALTMDNETSQLLWSDVHDNHHWVHVVNDGSYQSFSERKGLS